MLTRRRGRGRHCSSLNVLRPLLAGTVMVVLLAAGLMAPVPPPAIAAAARTVPSSPIRSSSILRHEATDLATPGTGPTSTTAATGSTQTTAPLDLGSDGESSSGGGLSNGTVAVIVIGSVLAIALVAATLIGRHRRRQS
jgi:hypothetical protein